MHSPGGDAGWVKADGEPTKTRGSLQERQKEGARTGRAAAWRPPPTPADNTGSAGGPRVSARGVRGRRSQSPQNLQGREAGRGGVPRRNGKGIPGTGSGEAAFAFPSAMPQVPTHVPADPAVPGPLRLADPRGDVPGATSELLWAPGANAHGTGADRDRKPEGPRGGGPCSATRTVSASRKAPPGLELDQGGSGTPQVPSRLVSGDLGRRPETRGGAGGGERPGQGHQIGHFLNH